MRCTLKGVALTVVEDVSRTGYVNRKALVMVDREPVMVELQQRQEWPFGDGEECEVQVRAEVQFGRLVVRYFPARGGDREEVPAD